MNLIITDLDSRKGMIRSIFMDGPGPFVCLISSPAMVAGDIIMSHFHVALFAEQAV